MTLLADVDVCELLRSHQLAVEPLDLNLLQPASLDMRLARAFLRMRPGAEPIDPDGEPPIDLWEKVVMPSGVPFVLRPNDFALASTVEKVTMPDDHAARFEGKSSRGRIGLTVHVTAGFVDPGFAGKITLELRNLGVRPINLYPGMLVGQLCLFRMSQAADRPYGSKGLGSHYQGQDGPTPSRAWMGAAQ